MFSALRNNDNLSTTNSSKHFLLTLTRTLTLGRLPRYDSRGNPALRKNLTLISTQMPQCNSLPSTLTSMHSAHITIDLTLPATSPPEAHAKSQYTTVGGNCKTEFTFTGDSKGFEASKPNPNPWFHRRLGLRLALRSG